VGFSGYVIPYANKLSQANDLNGIVIYHYHGSKDPLFNVDQTRSRSEKFWNGKADKFNIEIEEGLGHSLSTKGVACVNRVIEEVIKSQI
jgi:predicted esterase